MTRLRWGILGTSYFARHKMIPALRACRHAEVSAIASRSLERAGAVAAEYEIAKAYGSYSELLADSEIDAVYVPLPNHLHVPWSIKSLEAGKHVLCEKPVALSAAEARQLLLAAERYPHLKVMEAFMYRFHPQWQRARAVIREGGIGELRTVHSFFFYSNTDVGNIRNQVETGGGGMMDIGCYSVSLSRFLFDGEPRRVLGILGHDPIFGTDRQASGILDFGKGTATFTCSTQVQPYQRVQVLGSEGRIEIEIPFNPPPHERSRLWHHHGTRFEEISFEPCNQYTLQADQFSLAVLNGTPVPIPLTDALNNMKTIAAVLESGRRNEWIVPS